MSRETSLKASILDGFYASVMFGLTVNYFTPFGLLFGISEFTVGLLNTLPLLGGAVIQLFSDDITARFNSRVRAIVFFVALQAASLFLIASVAYLPSGNALKVPLVVLFVVIHFILGSVATPAWAALMSDTVDASEYGRYFAWRGKVLGFVNLVSSLAGGGILYFVKNKTSAFVGIFAIAGLCRFLSAYYLSKMDDVSHADFSVGKSSFTYPEFIKRWRESNFVKFVLFVSLINFGTFLASPFFAVYMLEVLHFNYRTYALVTSSAAAAGLIGLPLWGRLADRYGNASVVKISSKFLPILPLLWVISSEPLYLIVINAIAGYFWAGFNLATVNFIFDAASPAVRARCVGYFNFTNGIFIALGGVAGGWLATKLPSIGQGFHPLVTLFIISGLARLVVVAFGSGMFNEVKKVKSIGSKEMLYLILGARTDSSLGEETYRRRNGS